MLSLHRISGVLLALTVALGLLLFVSPGAHAGTVQATCDIGDSDETGCLFTYEAGKGKRDRVHLTWSGTHQAWDVLDLGARLTVRRGCRRISARRARCRLAKIGTVRSFVRLGDRGDRALIGQSDRRRVRPTVEVFGGAGADRIDARRWRGPLVAHGDAGGDVMIGGHGADELQGGTGRDRLIGGPGNDALFGGAGRDRLAGQSGDDEIFGDDSPAGGTDRYPPASDVIFGGRGSDTVSYVGLRAPVVVDLARRTAGRSGEHDTLSSIENARGGDVGPNVLRGDAGPNRLQAGYALYGSASGDRLIGRGGNDVLIGGHYDDLLDGGPGNDVIHVLDQPLDRSSGGTDDIRCSSGADIVAPARTKQTPTTFVPRSCERVAFRRDFVRSFPTDGVIASFAHPVAGAEGLTIDVRFRLRRAGIRQSGSLTLLDDDRTLLGRATWSAVTPAHQTLRFTLTEAGRRALARHDVVAFGTSPYRTGWRMGL